MGPTSRVRESWLVRSHAGALRFVRRWDLQPGEDTRLVDRLSARAALRSGAAHHWNGGCFDAMLGAFRQRGGRPPGFAVPTADVLSGLIQAVDSGELVAVQEALTTPMELLVAEELPWEPRPPEAPTRVTASIDFTFVYDQADEGVGGLRFKVRSHEAQEKTLETDGAGTLKLRGILPGTVELETDPAEARLERTLTLRAVADAPTSGPTSDDEPKDPATHLLRVEARRVRHGETFKSLALDCDIPWKDLAKFNFGTDDEQKVLSRLVQDVGCLAADSLDELVFDELDEPGVLFIPRPWKASFHTSQTPILRLAGVTRPRLAFVFSA